METLSAYTRDQETWARKLAAQLKLVQSDFAESDSEQRCVALSDAIDNHLRPIAPEQRAQYLLSLADHFPAGMSGEAYKSTPENANAIEQTPEELVNRLVQMAPVLSKRKLQELGTLLQAAGYLEVKTTTLLDAPSEELVKRFPIEPGQMVDLQRAYRLLATMGDFIFSMDQLVWQVWRSIAPSSRIRKDVTPSGDFRVMGGRYLSGDKEVAIAQISAIIDRLRQLIAGIIAGIGPAGRGFSRKHLATFSPEAIREVASLESGFMVSIEQKCWRKYSELAKDLSEDMIQSEILEALGRYAEDLMKGTSNS
jgi:hypothetical protein